jgi:CheY-like chemotaxis protein/HPt (histidine-containing phosphotransfer) domain-containing protein
LSELGRTARILLAEDNATNQLVAVQLLRGFDVKLDVVGDGLEAVHAACNFQYDVICMDMRMPEMDGLAATREIRSRGGRLATVPVIALTANTFPEDVAACFDAGMTGFVAKPVNKRSLVSALIAALDRKDPAAIVAPRRDRTEPALDRASFARLKEDIEEQGVADLIAMFEAETLDRLARIADPHLDRGTLSREVHSLKGAAAAASATLLSRRAADLEIRLEHGEGMNDDDIPALTEALDAWGQELGSLDIKAGAGDQRILLSG